MSAVYITVLIVAAVVAGALVENWWRKVYRPTDTQPCDVRRCRRDATHHTYGWDVCALHADEIANQPARYHDHDWPLERTDDHLGEAS